MLTSLKKLAMKFEPAQIIRKSTQVGGQTRRKQVQVKTCDDLRSRLIWALQSSLKFIEFAVCAVNVSFY